MNFLYDMFSRSVEGTSSGFISSVFVSSPTGMLGWVFVAGLDLLTSSALKSWIAVFSYSILRCDRNLVHEWVKNLVIRYIGAIITHLQTIYSFPGTSKYWFKLIHSEWYFLRTLVAGNHSGTSAGSFSRRPSRRSSMTKKQLNNHHMKSPRCLHGFSFKTSTFPTESLKLTANLVLKIPIISWTMIQISVWGNSHLGCGHLFQMRFWFPFSWEFLLQNDHQVDPPTPPTGQMPQIPPCHLGDVQLGFVYCDFAVVYSHREKTTIWENILKKKTFFRAS